jgi:hypothetical protein
VSENVVAADQALLLVENIAPKSAPALPDVKDYRLTCWTGVLSRE